MRIGIFTNNYLPNPYGVSASIESFRKEFEALGPARNDQPAELRSTMLTGAATSGEHSDAGRHQVFIFAPKWKEYRDENLNVFRYPSIDIEIKFRFPLPIPYSRRMDKIIENLDLDIIHSQHPNLLGSAAMKWAKKKNIPLVFTWHTLYDQYTHFFPFLPKKMAVSYIIKKAVAYANKCDQIIVPSQSALEIVQKWGVTNPNITAIPSGVERDFENPTKDIIRKKFAIDADEILLFSDVRLTAEKNVEFLVETVADILKNNRKVKFMAVGDGYLMPKLKEIFAQAGVSEQAIFCGLVDKKEIKNYFSAGDIFVYSSKSETQGMVITEAMYMGLPIVAVNATGICDLVENNINGFLVSENKSEFMETISKLINDAELRKKMGAESARIAREKYTAQICARKMLEVYNKVINNKNYAKIIRY